MKMKLYENRMIEERLLKEKGDQLLFILPFSFLDEIRPFTTDLVQGRFTVAIFSSISETQTMEIRPTYVQERVHSNCSWRGQGNRGRSWCVPLILEQRLHRFHDSKDKRQFLISLAETKLNSPRNFPNFRSHRNDSRHCVLGFSTPIATS